MQKKKKKNTKHAPFFFNDIWIGGWEPHKCEGMKNNDSQGIGNYKISKKKSSDTLQNILKDKHETFRME